MASTIRSDATQAVVNVNGVDQLKIKEDGKLEIRTAGTGDKDACIMGQSKLALATAVTASGTSVNFTVIPAWVNRITLMFNVLSTNGSQPLIVQLGTPAGYVNTGYVSNTSVFQHAGSVSSTLATPAGFYLDWGSASTAGAFRSGQLTFNRVSGNLWTCSGISAQAQASGYSSFVGGAVVPPQTVDRIQIISASGADIFDSGTVNISWE